MQVRFTQASRKHRLGRAHVLHVMATTTPVELVTARGNEGWLYVGEDDRGLELEVIAVVLDTGDVLVIHAMPTALRPGGDDDAQG